LQLDVCTTICQKIVLKKRQIFAENWQKSAKTVFVTLAPCPHVCYNVATRRLHMYTKIDHNIGFEEKRLFFRSLAKIAENWQKW
jgi:hypothetical protein